MMIYICKECGTSYARDHQPPERCPICEDERQYVPASGQAWTTPEELSAGHVNAWRRLEPDLFEIHTRPDFAIGQRALLVRTPAGNFLWDCVSHPHYYTRCQDWASAFGCPVHLHAADREWVMRTDPAMRFWEGDQMALVPGLTLLRLGGHFPGASVLHWSKPDSAAVLLSGDTIRVVADPNRVTFMWSYPNSLPLSASSVRRIADTLKPWPVDRIYSFEVDRAVKSAGSRVIECSARRYIDVLSEEH